MHDDQRQHSPNAVDAHHTHGARPLEDFRASSGGNQYERRNNDPISRPRSSNSHYGGREGEHKA